MNKVNKQIDWRKYKKIVKILKKFQTNLNFFVEKIWFYLNENKPNRGQINPINLDLRKQIRQLEVWTEYD